jgi:subtilisin-like proprotein convertase family protein
VRNTWCFRMLLAAACLATAARGAAFADADFNPQSIAVPALGTQGAASVYPSSLVVRARGGTTQTGVVTTVLHGVTHPCPEELAILLVHNGHDKFLLMSSAGGCRPLQGTTMRFNISLSSTPIPDEQPASPPYDDAESFRASNYGPADPAFPAPAPPGPYGDGPPPSTTIIDGTWQLYVFDTTPGNRGVIAGGWSIEYDAGPSIGAEQTNVSIPGGGGTSGPASAYPITFDLTTVPEDVIIDRLRCEIVLSHTHPDNLRIVLQGPTGEAVVLMANAGGSTDLVSTEITFLTGFGTTEVVPDAGAITPGSYRPGGQYENNVALLPPAPQPPYATSFDETFEDRPARGQWRLWVYDDAAVNTGVVESATLHIDTAGPPSISYTGLAAAGAFTMNQPFVRFEGTVEDVKSITWRSIVGDDPMTAPFYAAGGFTRIPGTNQIYADIPLKQGKNTIRHYVKGWSNLQISQARTITVDEFTYSLAEGATGSFFDLDVTIANPAGGGGAPAATITDFLLEGGGVQSQVRAVPAGGQFQFHVDDIVPNTSSSTVVHSTSAVPLAVERTMIWDARGYGGHGGTSVAPATRWLFAEGSQGYFDTYVLLANDNATPVDASVSFLLEGGGVFTQPVTVPAKGRFTLYAGGIAAVVNRSFGIDVTSPLPIIAERAMYLPGARLFEGGHESAGVNSPSTRWFLAEGATGSFFDCFVLISNPGAAPANVTLTYLLESGQTVVKNAVVPPQSRHTINVETEHPRLANAAVSTTVTSDVGIVVERAMYWPDISQGWQEAHNSFGVTETALRWGLADGRIGGPRAYTTYVLLANPNPVAAEVSVRFLRPDGGAPVMRGYTLAPTSRLNIWVNNDVPELGEGAFSAEVQVLNYQPIAVEKALYWNSEGLVWAGGTNVTATRLPPP